MHKNLLHKPEITTTPERDAGPQVAYRGPFKKAFDISEFYGFTTLKPVTPDGKGVPMISLKERVFFIKSFLENKFGANPSPLLAAYLGESPDKEPLFKMEIVGIGKSVAEAILFQAASAILDSFGTHTICVDINSAGDRESMQYFVRELTGYYRKNVNCLHAPCRQAFKKDVLKLLSCNNEKCIEIRGSAPKAMSFLTEASRQHFKEVLEFLEATGISYELNDTLVDSGASSSKTIFEIHSGDEVVARGSRYDGLAKKLGSRRDVPAVGIAIKLKRSKEVDKYLPATRRETVWQIFFIQLGFEAKQKSFPILERLRKAKIAVYHTLNREDLVSQLSIADKLNVSYTIILGQREVVDGTVIVRDMRTRSQDTVRVSDLISYLEKAGVCKK